MTAIHTGNFKNGFWMWDEVNNGLLFVNPRLPSTLNVNAIRAAAAKVTKNEMVFRETVDHLDKARFRRYHQRRCKPNEPQVITIQDLKDVAIYIANPKRLSLDFLKLFHTPTVDKFLRALIVYFQFYIQVRENVLLRREEKKSKLYQPIVTQIENNLRNDLADLRCVASREYGTILIGAEETRKFHHMLSNKNNTSLSDKDRKLFEEFICMSARVVWIALYRKNLSLIESEMNHLLRTKIFNSLTRSESLTSDGLSHEEEKILYGTSNTVEKKLLLHSLITKEMTLGHHDYRLLMIGIKQYQPTDKRMEYLEIALTAPEELLLKKGVTVGMLGLPRDDYDVMLSSLTHNAKRRLMKKPRILPQFKLPPPVVHSPANMPKEFPKVPPLYKDTRQKVMARKDQFNMWKKVLERSNEVREMSVLDLSGSQALLSSRSSISMATRRSVQVQQVIM
ncbi:hypothetical protein RI129_001585 [Pyrocoelia pectoralis]|uniref:Protein phosphatase 1 regulatory subunit 36 n=1 Tax=Pyrocoelia pectoralis TaxID=417401 RepID=A0AAN7ZXG3_9COLE